MEIEKGNNMGIYLNPGNEQFRKAVSKTIYVDKSLLIDVVSNYARNRVTK